MKKKTIILITIILIFTVTLAIKSLDSFEKYREDVFVFAVEKKFEDSGIYIKLSESQKKVIDEVPGKIKLNIINNGKEKFDYYIRLEDTTNATGGCPDPNMCIKTLLSEKGEIIEKSDFEKIIIFDTEEIKNIYKDSSENYFYSYNLEISIGNETKNNEKFFYHISGSYGYVGYDTTNGQARYKIDGGRYVCKDNICTPADN